MQHHIKKAKFGLILIIITLTGILLAACDSSSTSSTAQPTTNTTTAATITTSTTPITVSGAAPSTATTIATTQPTTNTTTNTTATATATTVAGGTTSDTATTATATTTAPATTGSQTRAATTVAVTPVAVTDTSKPRYIAAMRSRTYSSGPIEIGRLYEQNSQYKANLITYQSDGLTISGLIFVPIGKGPFPLALVNHGYFDPSNYGPGWDTLRELRYFASNGYVTIASDYRNYGSSSKGDNTIQPGYTDDILNLIEAAKKTSYIDKNKITIMGHSMGGEITLDILVVSKDIKVAALFGTMSADAADNYYARFRWGSKDTGQYAAYYGTPDKNPDNYKKLSPLTYFNDILVPVEINSGTNDTTTPPAWSQKVYNALKTDGKETVLYNYPGEGHSLNGAAFNLAMQRTLVFFNHAIGR